MNFDIGRMSTKTNGPRIEVVPYNENWPIMFDAEKAVISAALGDNCVEILHVGSTSIPGLAAKPIIDIIAIAKERQNAVTSLEKAGYTHKGERNIPLKMWLYQKRTHRCQSARIFR
jgi:GrpB-like predicted nucleotidyltransferase (UPF0157 family)